MGESGVRILVIEDERGIANFIKEGLEEEGFAVDVAGDGPHGLELAQSNDYDLLLIDWMIPGISGIEVCRQVRQSDPRVPMIFLTAKDTVQDVVFGLEAGANDYIKKPFAFDELLARVRVQLRPRTESQENLTIGSIELKRDTHEVLRAGLPVELTPKEFSLLEFLMQNKGKVCTRTRIIEHVWDIHFDADTSVIDVYINFLRKKLNDDSRADVIQTVRGVGYVMREPG